jgi:alpha-glucoside transport system substrate-binding protein
MAKKWFNILALLVVLSLLLAACGGETPTATPEAAATAATADTPTTAAAAETPTEAAMAGETPTTGTAGGGTTGPTDYSKIGQELADAMTGKYKGTTVSISHGLSGDEEAKFKGTFTDFTSKTGINVKLVSGGTVEVINTKVQANTIEDIVNFPQPGTMAGYAKQGKIIDLNKVINQDWLKQNYKTGFITTNTVKDASGNDILGGVFERINFKGAVWYPKKAFDAAGYKIPTTWDEQQKLMDQIVSDGDTPWCFGIESGGASGWPATDIEKYQQPIT